LPNLRSVSGGSATYPAAGYLSRRLLQPIPAPATYRDAAATAPGRGNRRRSARILARPSALVKQNHGRSTGCGLPRLLSRPPGGSLRRAIRWRQAPAGGYDGGSGDTEAIGT